MTACRIVRVLLPTDVAKAFATSLLPVANPKKNAAVCQAKQASLRSQFTVVLLQKG
jgi:hypothetical protein